MPRLLNLGSINLDLVYRMRDIVRPGETLASLELHRGAGGKGLNQSIAAARAGACVYHGGRVGRDGQDLVTLLDTEGVNTHHILVVEDRPTGHAIIQVAASGENAIVLHAGANQALSPLELPAMFTDFNPGDWFLTQNETSCVSEALAIAAGRGLRVAFNPAPMTGRVAEYPLHCVDLLIVNETEAATLAHAEGPVRSMAALRAMLPHASIALTLGPRGVWWSAPEGDLHVVPPTVKAVDTTGAGDTFIGYLLAGVLRDEPMTAALSLACRAAALSTTRPGAASAIPTAAEAASFDGT